MSKLSDGYQTLISFSANSSIKLWEKTVTPPAISGGGGIDTTGMTNETYRTKAPKSLLTIENTSSTCRYDPAVYSEILALMNVVNTITLTWPDATTLSFEGFLDVFTPNELTEGEEPTAEIDIIAGNENAAGTETGPS